MTFSGYDARRSGPVAHAYLQCTAPCSVIMGPEGSGKTAASIWKVVQHALRQRPYPDGVRRVRGAVIRDTYPLMEKNVLPSWFKFFPKDDNFVGSAPMSHKIKLNFLNKYKIEIDVMFIAVGDNSVDNVVEGLEIDFAWLNSIDMLPPTLLTAMLSRVMQGRSRPTDKGGPTEITQLWGDCNAYDTENYLYKLFQEKTDAERPGFKFYRQPPGLLKTNSGYVINPDAENLRVVTTLERAYLTNAETMPLWELRRKVLNEFGFSREGKPVYEEWNDGWHVSPHALRWNPRAPLIVGIDQGFHPAAVFLQRHPTGQWRCLSELVGENVVASVFGEMFNTHVAERYPDARIEMHYDPASDQRSATDDDARAWIDSFKEATQIHDASAARSNDIGVRVQAVTKTLKHAISGAPAFLLDPGCVTLRKGFNSGYKLQKTGKDGGEVILGQKPVKNAYSHPHDALQYAILGGGEYEDLRGRGSSQKTLTAEQMLAAVQAPQNFNPHQRLL